MFENPGQSIKLIAKVVFGISVVLSIIIGLMAMGGGTLQIGSTAVGSGIIPGLLAIGLGCLSSWACTVVLYGFGQLVEDTRAVRKRMEEKHTA